MSIGMYPFKEIYGYDASNFIDHIFGDSISPKDKDWIEESKEILKVLRDNCRLLKTSIKNMHTNIEWRDTSKSMTWFT